MKKCQFCAEDIQDAAIVCKHCGRDLVQEAKSAVQKSRVAKSSPPTRRRPWLWVALAPAVLIGAYALVQWSRQDYLEFAAHRDDWHRRCDAYISAPPSLGRVAQVAAACKTELDEMMAYAIRKGWQ